MSSIVIPTPFLIYPHLQVGVRTGLRIAPRFIYPAAAWKMNLGASLGIDAPILPTGALMLLTCSRLSLGSWLRSSPPHSVGRFSKDRRHMNTTQTSNAILAGILSLWNLAAAGQNLLTNGDFEAGNTNFTSDYTFAPTVTADGSYDIVRNPRDSHSGAASFTDHTTGSGLMLVANGAADTNRVIWRQSVQVTTNTTYEFSGWAASWGDDGSGHDPNPARLRISINGTSVGPAFQLSNQDGQWQGFSIRWRSKTSESALIELRLETAEGFGNDPAFDDFQFTVFQPRAVIHVATVEICWPSVPGTMYQVDYQSEATRHLWMPFGPPVEGTETTNCVIDNVTMPARFYRIREVQ
jgi:hypothetical protein